MQSQIWAAKEKVLFGFLERKCPYVGPYDTLVALLPNTSLLALASNDRLFMMDLSKSVVLARQKLRSIAYMLVANSQGQLLVVTQRVIYLYNFRLQLLRHYDLNGQIILSCRQDDKNNNTNGSFRIYYSGYHLVDQKLLQFFRIQPKLQAAYWGKWCVWVNSEANRLMLIDLDNNCSEQISGLSQEQIGEVFHLRMHRGGQNLAIIQVNHENLLVLDSTKKFLYSCKNDGKMYDEFYLEKYDETVMVYRFFATKLMRIGSLGYALNTIQAFLSYQDQFVVVRKSHKESRESRIVQRSQLTPFAQQIESQSIDLGEDLEEMISGQGLHETLKEEEPVDLLHESAVSTHQMKKDESLSIIDEQSSNPQTPMIQECQSCGFNVANNLFCFENLKNNQMSKNQTFSSHTAVSSFTSSVASSLTPAQAAAAFKQEGDLLLARKVRILKENISESTLEELRYKNINELIRGFYKKRGLSSVAALEFKKEILDDGDENYFEFFINDVIQISEILQILQQLAVFAKKHPNNQKFKKWYFSKIPSHTLISTLPHQLLPFNATKAQQDLLTTLLPLIKLSDLSSAQTLYETLMETYFVCGDNLPDFIIVQGEQIQISNTRNMLNVLLYICQMLEHEAQWVFKGMFLALLRRKDYELIQSIVYKEKALSICGLKIEVLFDAVKAYQKELYFASKPVVQQFDQALEVLRGNVDIYTLKANRRFTLTQTLERNLDFFNSYINIYKMEEKKNGIQLLQKIINQENGSLLVNLSIEKLYQCIWIVECAKEGHTQLHFYTEQLLRLADMLVLKCVREKLFHEAYECMAKIRSRLRPSTLIIALAEYLESNSKPEYLQKCIPAFIRSSAQELFELYQFCLQNNYPENLSSDFTDLTSAFFCDEDTMVTFFSEFRGIVDTRISPLKVFEYGKLLYYSTQAAYQMALKSPKYINIPLLDGMIEEAVRRDLMCDGRLGWKATTELSGKTEIAELPLIYHVPILEKWPPERQDAPHQAPSKQQPIHKVSEDLISCSFEIDKSQQYNSSPQLGNSYSQRHISVPVQRQSDKSLKILHMGQQGHMTRSSKTVRKMNSFKHTNRSARSSISDDGCQEEQLREAVSEGRLKQYLHAYYYSRPLSDFTRMVREGNSSKLIGAWFRFYRLQSLCEIEDYGLSYDFRNVFNFGFLLHQSSEEAYDEIEGNIRHEISVKTFWLIQLMLEKMLGPNFNKSDLVLMYIQNEMATVCKDQDEAVAQRVSAIFQSIRVNKNALRELGERLLKKGLKLTAEVVRKQIEKQRPTVNRGSSQVGRTRDRETNYVN